MKRLSISLATGLVLGLLLLPGAAYAACGGDACAVGGAGTGGERSDGRAQGFREEYGALIGDNQLVLVTNVGNADAGHITLSGARDGTLSGTYRNGVGRGRGTGYFGDWAGRI
jgi:hypothetical protein